MRPPREEGAAEKRSSERALGGGAMLGAGAAEGLAGAKGSAGACRHTGAGCIRRGL